MKNLLLKSLLILLLPVSGYAACTQEALGLLLKLPNYGDRGDVWAKCVRDNFDIINDASVSTTTLTGYVKISTPVFTGGLMSTSWANFASSVTAQGGFFGDGSRLTGVITSTSAIQTQINAIAVSTGANTVDIAALKVSTGAIDTAKANRAGDRFTGSVTVAAPLTVTSSSITVQASQPTLYLNGSLEPIIRMKSDNASAGAHIYMLAEGDTPSSGYDWLIWDTSTALGNKLAIYPRSGIAATFTQDGKLGVGNTFSPTHTLDVTGGGRFTSTMTASAYYGDGSNLTGIPTNAQLAAIAVSTGALEASKVNRAGDTMTGQLALTGSSVKLKITDTTQQYFDASATNNYLAFYKDLSPSYVAAIGNNVPAGALQEALVFSRYDGGWAEQMRIAKNGFIGMGITAPATNLHVQTSDAATNTTVYPLWLNHSTTNTPAAGLGSGMLFNAERSDGNEAAIAGISAVWTSPTAGVEDGDLVFSPTYNSSLTERMRVTSGGNVGINTSSPEGKLNIGNTISALPAYTNGQGEGLIINASRIDSNHYETVVDFVAGRASASPNGGGEFRFFTQPLTGAPVESLHLNHEGGVRILAGSLIAQGGGYDNTGPHALIVGGNAYSYGFADAYRKIANIETPHYSAATSSVTLIYADNDATNNSIFIGGGNGYRNSATKVAIWTGANGSYAGGSERLAVNSAGNVIMGAENFKSTFTYATGALTLSGSLVTNSGSNVDWVPDNGTTYQPFRVVLSGAGRNIATINSVSGNGTLALYNSGEVFTTHLNSAGISYLNGGNVGVGTASPYSKLDVSVDKTWSGGYGQIVASDGSTPAKQITMGFDGTENIGWLQARQWSSGYRDVHIQPSGGNLRIGPANYVSTFTATDGSWAYSGNVALKTYTETKSSAAVSTTYDVSWSSGSVYWLSLNDNTTLTFSSAVEGQSLTLFVKQNVGSKAITWPTISWPSATAPTLTTTAGKTDIISLVYIGGVYYGFLGGQNY